MDGRTPTCPSCGAKFSGDPCNRCGIPAALAGKGPGEVRAYREQRLVDAGVSKRQRKQALRARPASGNRHRLRHGVPR